MRTLLAALALLALAGSAQAQSQSVFAPAPPVNPLASFQQGYGVTQRMAEDQQARQATQAAQNQAVGDQAMRQQLGRMIRVGDCQGAMKATLDAGRLDLAREVQALCEGH